MKIKTLYIDNTHQGDGPIAVFIKDTQVIYTGTLVNTAPVNMRSAQIVRDAARYGVYFFFDDDAVSLNLYTIPYTESFARDEHGGFFVREADDDAPIYHIDAAHQTHKAAKNLPDFLEKLQTWAENMEPSQGIAAFSSREEAKQGYEIYDMDEILGWLGDDATK